MNPWEIIQKLEAHSSRLDKEQIIADNRDNLEFLEGCRLALDPMITFGLKQIPVKTGEDGPGISHDAFTIMITGFTTRNVTGNTARDVINTMMNIAKKDEWNDWYRRILIKDLRCGVSEKTINKVVKGAIPVFECQLSHDSANHESKVAGKKMIEVKLDGVRVLTVVYPEGRVDQYSRNGKELLNFGHIKEQFAGVASSLSEPTVFDGEVMSSSFQDLMKQVHRKDNVAAGDAVLHLFDIVPLNKFQAGKFDVKQRERTARLQQWYQENMNKLPNVTVLDHAVVDLDTAEGQKLFGMYNKSAVENGYEGIMIKDLNAPYECKRITAWLKLKPFIEVSLEVIGVEEGTGRNVGRLGAFVCEGIDDGKTIRVNVGSGFSDSDRNSFWASHVELDNIIGQVVEVRADAVTQNQDGTYSLRFPRFKTFRGFELHEKL
jgi:DNA ligase-1